MLTFKSTKQLVILLLVLLFLADFFWDITPWMYLTVGLLFLGLISWGSYHIQSNFFIKGIHKGKTTDKIVALTFDDGPTPGITEEVLTILEEYQATATFFLIGNQITDNVSIVKRIVAEGHLIGNHSLTHDTKIGFFGVKLITNELESTNKIIRTVTGKGVNWFRPPFGVTNPIIAKVVRGLDLEVIGWSVRTYDTVRKDPEVILKAVKRGLCPGAVILLHDRFEYTTATLRLILNHLAEEGYTVVGLDKLLGKPAYS